MQPQPQLQCAGRDVYSFLNISAFHWEPCFLARWQGLLSLRDGRLDKVQTSGAGWVPCVVYGGENERGHPSGKSVASMNRQECVTVVRTCLWES